MINWTTHKKKKWLEGIIPPNQIFNAEYLIYFDDLRCIVNGKLLGYGVNVTDCKRLCLDHLNTNMVCFYDS